MKKAVLITFIAISLGQVANAWFLNPLLNEIYHPFADSKTSIRLLTWVCVYAILPSVFGTLIEFVVIILYNQYYK